MIFFVYNNHQFCEMHHYILLNYFWVFIWILFSYKLRLSIHLCLKVIFYSKLVIFLWIYFIYKSNMNFVLMYVKFKIELTCVRFFIFFFLLLSQPWSKLKEVRIVSILWTIETCFWLMYFRKKNAKTWWS